MQQLHNILLVRHYIHLSIAACCYVGTGGCCLLLCWHWGLLPVATWALGVVACCYVGTGVCCLLLCWHWGCGILKEDSGIRITMADSKIIGCGGKTFILGLKSNSFTVSKYSK